MATIFCKTRQNLKCTWQNCCCVIFSADRRPRHCLLAHTHGKTAEPAWFIAVAGWTAMSSLITCLWFEWLTELHQSGGGSVDPTPSSNGSAVQPSFIQQAAGPPTTEFMASATRSTTALMGKYDFSGTTSAFVRCGVARLISQNWKLYKSTRKTQPIYRPTR